MNTFQTMIMIALVGNTALACLVLLCNPRRMLNISFSLLASLIALWLITMLFGARLISIDDSLFWPRQTSATGGLLPLGFFLVYLTVANPGDSLRSAFHKLRYLLIACLAVFVLCHSPLFMVSARPTGPDHTVPSISYGIGFMFFILYFIMVIIAMSVGFVRAYKKSSGVKREEFLFLQMGGCASLVFGVSLLSAGVIFDYQEIGIFLPLSVLVLDGFIAYGIATHRILSASVILQKTLSYALLIGYLLLLYAGVYAITTWVFKTMLTETSFVAHMLAAVVMAFSVAPVHGWMQAFSHHLLPNQTPIDTDEILKQARHIFQEISTEESLTDALTKLVMSTFGTVAITVLRQNPDHSFSQRHPPATDGHEPVSLEADNALIALLQKETEPVTLDMLERIRSSSLTLQSRRSLETRSASIAAGCFMRGDLKAVILLPGRESGRIYDLHDQRTLQLLCDQFAVALENSSLYTQVQNARIYNDILLNSLTCGIIAVSADRGVTVLNKQAQILTGLDESHAVDHPVRVLPAALAEALNTILDTRSGFRDQDTLIRTGAREIPIRVSGEMFHSHTGQLLGALVIFTDMTERRQMEEQIRRSDRLSSIGTLAAGMAHEIKNPLVTIKTFTQLLPEQYQDEDFRQTFFELVDQEVKRIDTIVNRLLNFARPASATLVPRSLHPVVDSALRLVSQQLSHHGIRLVKRLDAEHHWILADADLLNQAFINFFLNAVHAMPDGGTLAVHTTVLSHPPDPPQPGRPPGGSYILLDISDTGHGIPDGNLGRIFDPFFTTKEDGVGLGLSVSHGILQEHNAIVHVDSHPDTGTRFHIRFPLMPISQHEDRS